MKRYALLMDMVLFILISGALLAVLGSLALGLFAFVREGEIHRKNSQKMMQARVFLQGLALALFAIAMLSK